MVKVIVSFILKKENLSSLLHQGLLWSQTAPGQLNGSSIQKNVAVLSSWPSHRQGGPGDLLHHIIGSGGTKPSSLWLLPFPRHPS